MEEEHGCLALASEQPRMNSDSYRCTVLFLAIFTQLSPLKCAASY